MFLTLFKHLNVIWTFFQRHLNIDFMFFKHLNVIWTFFQRRLNIDLTLF